MIGKISCVVFSASLSLGISIPQQETKILLDCDQSNVVLHLAGIIFFCILFKSFFVPFDIYLLGV